MALRRFATIDGERIDITDAAVTQEHVCDRCGRYMTEGTIVKVPPGLLAGAGADVVIELDAACVSDHFAGLLDVATKVLGRA